MPAQNIDLPYFKDIQPEDIEDVSDQYVPLFAEERNADRVKKVQKGITKLLDFKYPSVLPIVYYEGCKNWTVPLDFRSRIMEGNTFGKFIPDFEYYLVPLRKYSNEELLANKDEISLVMMINRMLKILRSFGSFRKRRLMRYYRKHRSICWILLVIFCEHSC